MSQFCPAFQLFVVQSWHTRRLGRNTCSRAGRPAVGCAAEAGRAGFEGRGPVIARRTLTYSHIHIYTYKHTHLPTLPNPPSMLLCSCVCRVMVSPRRCLYLSGRGASPLPAGFRRPLQILRPKRQTGSKRPYTSTQSRCGQADPTQHLWQFRLPADIAWHLTDTAGHPASTTAHPSHPSIHCPAHLRPFPEETTSFTPGPRPVLHAHQLAVGATRPRERAISSGGLL